MEVLQSTFLTEVSEQPIQLKKMISFYRNEGLPLLSQWAKIARKEGRVHFVGMGTSEFAPECVLDKLANSGVDATTIDAGELLHYPRSLPGVIVLISQSGESIEVKKLAERFKGKGQIIAITNDSQSTLAHCGGLVLPMHAGEETAISTKTYVNTLAILFLMREILGDMPAFDRLEALAEQMATYDESAIERAADLVADAKSIHFIGRGPTLAAVKQAALTFMEGTRTTATAFTGGAFRHGPFELIDENHRCVIFAPGGESFDLLRKLIKEVSDKGSRAVVVTDQNFRVESDNVCILRVPEFGEDLFALSAATTQELLLDAVARRRGIVAGVFRYGQKITTRE